jgi:hypothetical protein
VEEHYQLALALSHIVQANVIDISVLVLKYDFPPRRKVASSQSRSIIEPLPVCLTPKLKNQKLKVKMTGENAKIVFFV